MRTHLTIGIALLIVLLTQTTFAMSLEEYLSQVQEKNGNFKSFSSSREASEAKQLAGDGPLNPKLTARAHRLDDKKPSYFFSNGSQIVLPKIAGTEYTLALSKKFSTGTDAEISGSLNDIGQYFPDNAGVPGPRVYGALGISITQSLWKDFFGRGTELRRQRESVLATAEKTGLDLQSRQVLIDAESAFWDYVYSQEEVRQREQSLERARRIEGWVKNRVGNGIGDRADLLNAQGLVAMRELELLSAKDDGRATEERIRTQLELPAGDKTPTLNGQLDQLRPIATQGKLVKLDALTSILEAKLKAISAQEVEDNMRPDLTIDAKYKTNSAEVEWSQASAKMADTSTPTTDIGIKFVYLLDGGLKENSRKMARMEALAAAQKKERKLLESESGWNEFVRRHSELTKKVQAAEKASQIQTNKAAAERDKLSKGRSITSQVITAEQDAAETTLRLFKLRAEQRKLEAQARMYVPLQEAP